MLAAYSGHSNAELTRLALLTPQTMSVIVANLLKADLIARQPHRVHGRIQTNARSESGQSLLEAAKGRVDALKADMLRDLGPAEQAVIRHWLVRIAGAGPT